MTVFATFILVFVIMITAVAAMSVGVIAGRKPISGSCGGVSGKGCELCSGRGRCRRKTGGEER